MKHRNIQEVGRIHLQRATFIIHYRKPKDTIMSFCKGHSQKIQPKLTRNNTPLEREPNSTMSPWHSSPSEAASLLQWPNQLPSAPPHWHLPVAGWTVVGRVGGTVQGQVLPTAHTTHHTRPHCLQKETPQSEDSDWNHHGLQSNWIFRLAHLFFILLIGLAAIKRWYNWDK